MSTKIITLLITGTVLTAGLMMGFGGSVFAGDPATGLDITICQNPPGPCSRVSDKIYDSSFSKTKSIGLVRKEVGDVLLRYGVGGADINKVTEALEGSGVYEAELKWFLLAIGINEKDAQDILLEFDKVGINKDGARAVSTPDATGAVPRAAFDEPYEPKEQGVSTPGTGDTSQSSTRCKNDSQCSAGMVCFENVCIPAPPAKHGGDPLKGLNISCAPKGCKKVIENLTDSIEDLKVVESKEQREDIKKELQANRQTLQKSAETLHQDLRENTQELRDNFRENMKTTIGHVDHGKTGRIAVAHGKGLRMVNRYRSAMARFDHILGRLESRLQKLEAQGVDISAVIPLIEEAKNKSVENEARMEELKAKYESLLLGENAGGIAKEAHEIAKELKSAIEKLHGLLGDIQHATGNYNSSLSNKDK